MDFRCDPPYISVHLVILRINDKKKGIKQNYERIVYMKKRGSLLRRQKKWLPDLDLNQDKLNQNQLCYRYTIRQNLC